MMMMMLMGKTFIDQRSTGREGESPLANLHFNVRTTSGQHRHRHRNWQCPSISRTYPGESLRQWHFQISLRWYPGPSQSLCVCFPKTVTNNQQLSISKVYLSKVYVCEVYPAYASSELIFGDDFSWSMYKYWQCWQYLKMFVKCLAKGKHRCNTTIVSFCHVGAWNRNKWFKQSKCAQ